MNDEVNVRTFVPPQPEPAQSHQSFTRKQLILGICVVLLMGILFVVISADLTNNVQPANKGQSIQESASRPVETPTPEWIDTAPIATIHRMLEDDYRRMIDEVNHSYYNGVQTRTVKHKGGYVLWAEHSFFSEYSFAIGDFGKGVWAWMSSHNRELRKAKITRVGVRGTGPYASWTYYDLP